MGTEDLVKSSVIAPKLLRYLGKCISMPCLFHDMQYFWHFVVFGTLLVAFYAYVTLLYCEKIIDSRLFEYQPLKVM